MTTTSFTTPGVARVLLADDDLGVRRLAARLLRMNGFEVAECSGGEDALRIAAESDRPFDVFVTDAIMPGMSGIETARRLNIAAPGLPVVLMSGYGEADLGESGASYFVAKPFNPSEFIAVVTRALNAWEVAVS